MLMAKVSEIIHPKNINRNNILPRWCKYLDLGEDAVKLQQEYIFPIEDELAAALTKIVNGFLSREYWNIFILKETGPSVLFLVFLIISSTCLQSSKQLL